MFWTPYVTGKIGIFTRCGARSIQFVFCKYSSAFDIAERDIEPARAALNNRATAHIRLGNYGHASSDTMRVGEIASTEKACEHLRTFW